MSAPLPPTEEERCAALRATGLLHTPPDPEFDEICRLAAQLCQTPIAAISLVDGGRQWFKSRVGPLPRETARADSFCAHTIRDSSRPLVVPDARADDRFAGSGLVTGEPFIRFYAGAPLVDAQGRSLGALCVMDRSPRTLDVAALESLATLARQLMRLVDSRRLVRQLAEQKAALDEHALVAITDPRGRITYANDRFCAISQYARAELIGQDHRIVNSGHHPKEFFRELWATLRAGRVWRGEICNRAKDRSLYWVKTTIVPILDPAGQPLEYVSIRADITHQKQTEAELQRQKSELRVLFDFIPAMVCYKDTENRILRTNQRMADYLGRPVADIEGRPTGEIFPEVADKFYADDLEVIRTGQPKLGIIESFAGQSGREVRIQTDKVPVRDEQGRITGLIAMAQDITARQRAEEALQQRQSELQVLFDLMPAMVWFKDTRNNFLRANRTAADFAGLSVGDFVGRPCRDLYPDQADMFYADDLEVIRTGQPKLGIIEPIADRDGHQRWIQTDKVPYRDKAGNIVGIVVMAQDTTARREGEERLRLLGSALEQCKDSIVITDAGLESPGPRIQFVNPAFTAMTGYTADEVIGRTLDFQQGPLSDAAALGRLSQALARGEASQDEMVSYRKDGTTFDLEWNVTPVRDAAGRVTQFVGIQRDVTARNSVAADLVRAREEALESGRLKSRFLANMSHELRTPLNTINGVAATLLEQELPAHLTSPVGLILQCGEALLQNIQTILTHSSLESGRFSLESRAFSPADVALNALRIAGDKARRKGLILDYHLDPAVPALVDGDAFRLQQVLVNFLANAIKFTDRGRVCLRVRPLRGSNGRVDLRFTVADSGLGIPAAQLAQLFTPFAQADNSGTRRFEGTGLGLAISKTLVDLMGGSVGVRSRPGRGSFFYFTLPFLTTSVPRPLGTATAHASLAGRQVLIEEARPLRQRMLLELARAWGLRPTFVPNAGAAAVAAAERRFDFALRPALANEPAEADSALPVVWLCASATPVAARGRAVSLTDLFSATELSAALVWLLSAVPRAHAGTGAAIRKLGERIPLRILAADDIATNREMLTYLCRHLGYRTDLVVDGVELVGRVSAQPYDLLLIDVNMPRMDGLAAAREICRLFPDPAHRPKLVAVTANALAGDRERCLAAGMDEYLSKPLLPKALVACIERLFVEKPVAAAAPPPPAAERPAVALLDLEHLKSVTEGMEPADASELIGQLRDSVIRDYDALRAPLIAACTAREGGELEKIVHGLKGCFLSVGWTRLGGRCAEAMGELRAGTFQGWAGLADEIHALQQASNAELASVLAAPAPSPAAPVPQPVVTAL